MQMKNFIIVLCFFQFIISCKFNGNLTYENEKSEKQDAESVAALLYLYTSREDYNKILEQISDSFFKVSSRKLTIDYLLDKKINAGKFKYFTLKNWQTKRTLGDNPKNEYLLIYEVTYTNKKLLETIILVKEKAQIKIISYSFNEVK